MKTPRPFAGMAGILLSFLLPALIPAGVPAEPPLRWQEKISFPRDGALRVAFGNGIFLALGEGGNLSVSSDGENWEARVSGTDRSLEDAAYGGGLFVAVGAGGTILSSPDGLAWTGRRSGTGYDLLGVTYGGGTFVAVGDGGIILTSADGITWRTEESGIHERLGKVAFGRDGFVAVGRNGTLLASPEGTAWTARLAGTHAHLEGIVFGGDRFVAVGEAVLTSGDGKEWTGGTAGTGQRLRGVAYGGGYFAAAGEGGTLLISPDGIHWNPQDTGTRLLLRTVAHGKGRFLAAGERGVLLSAETLASPRISVSSTSLNFGSVAVGRSSSATLTAANSGSGDLAIRQIAISGENAVNFTTQDDGCTGTALPPGASCSLRVVFSPNSGGAKSATLSIASNDPANPSQSVSLSGTGTGTDGGVIIASGSSGSFCFISTSVRGTGLEDRLDIIRSFRDEVLSRSALGKRLTAWYYRYSPAANRLLRGHDFLQRAVAHGMVPPLAAFARAAVHPSPGEIAALVLLACGTAAAGGRLLRRRWGRRARPFPPSPQGRGDERRAGRGADSGSPVGRRAIFGRKKEDSFSRSRAFPGPDSAAFAAGRGSFP